MKGRDVTVSWGGQEIKFGSFSESDFDNMKEVREAHDLIEEERERERVGGRRELYVVVRPAPVSVGAHKFEVGLRPLPCWGFRLLQSNLTVVEARRMRDLALLMVADIARLHPRKRASLWPEIERTFKETGVLK